MTDAITTGLISDITVQDKFATETKSKELGQDVFLELMVTQMRNQNPLDPQKNSEFVAQLAQFSSVEGLDKLNNTMDSFVGSFESSLQSNQALQASAMVGRFVKVDSDTSYLGTDGLIAGTVDVPQTTDDLTIKVYNEEGALVAEELMGEAEAGPMDFAWDGAYDGAQLPAGNYRFEAYANFGGDDVQLNTALSHNVDSVSVGANGAVSLNVAGVGPVSIASVRQIL